MNFVHGYCGMVITTLQQSNQHYITYLHGSIVVTSFWQPCYSVTTYNLVTALQPCCRTAVGPCYVLQPCLQPCYSVTTLLQHYSLVTVLQPCYSITTLLRHYNLVTALQPCYSITTLLQRCNLVTALQPCYSLVTALQPCYSVTTLLQRYSLVTVVQPCNYSGTALLRVTTLLQPILLQGGCIAFVHYTPL
jgi:hypothetical protein